MKRALMKLKGDIVVSKRTTCTTKQLDEALQHGHGKHVSFTASFRRNDHVRNAVLCNAATDTPFYLLRAAHFDGPDAAVLFRIILHVRARIRSTDGQLGGLGRRCASFLPAAAQLAKIVKLC